MTTAGWVGAAVGGVLAPVLGVALIAALSAPPTAGGPGGLAPGTVPAQWQAAVIAAGNTCPAVSAPLIAAQIEQESGWNPAAVSSAGAVGLSQFLPGTWAGIGVDANGDGSADPLDPLDAIATQATYDCGLAVELAGVPGDPVDTMLAGYNAGPGAVLAARGIPAIAETQGYVRAIRALTATYAAPIPAAPGDRGGIVALAASFIGTRYLWGGSEPGGFDCSGLTSYAYLHAAGITIPRTSQAQQAVAAPVPAAQVQAGDLVFFGRPAGHVGLVIDPAAGTMIDAPNTGAVVRVESYRTWSDVSGFGRFV